MKSPTLDSTSVLPAATKSRFSEINVDSPCESQNVTPAKSSTTRPGGVPMLLVVAARSSPAVAMSISPARRSTTSVPVRCSSTVRCAVVTQVILEAAPGAWQVAGRWRARSVVGWRGADVGQRGLGIALGGQVAEAHHPDQVAIVTDREPAHRAVAHELDGVRRRLVRA